MKTKKRPAAKPLPRAKPDYCYRCRYNHAMGAQCGCACHPREA